MKKCCSQCTTGFEISAAEIAFYGKVSPSFAGKQFPIPVPDLCPRCRAQRRLSFRNFFNLHHRTSTLSGQKILSMYAPESPFPVYEMREWWGDAWDGLNYGRAPSFDRPVFAQLQGLHESVPRMNISNFQTENTDYCNFSFQSRSCYLVFGNVSNEDCLYGHIVWRSKDCLDCLYVYRSELCYECVDCVDCYDVRFSVGADNCRQSEFLLRCVGCSNCFGCVGLRNREYCLFNEQLDRSEYLAKIKDLYVDGVPRSAIILKTMSELGLAETVKYYHGFGNENVTGDYLYSCKNVFDSYDMKNCEECRYCATLESFVDCMDCNFAPARTELTYNCLTGAGYHLLMCHSCQNGSNLLYCDNCYGCRDCFGCVGLKQKQYCIFNVEYNKDDYESLVARLIELMIQGGEWGLFFPGIFSPFGYNETIAQEYFPMGETEALARGFRWSDRSERSYQPQTYQVPTDIRDVGDNIITETLACCECQKNYKIIAAELAFYRRQSISVPRRCFTCRHKARMALRNPRSLSLRSCEICKLPLQTTYSSESRERVVCESCYLSSQ